MIKVILYNSKGKELCYHSTKSMREADSLAETYNRMDGIQTTIEVQ